jgi:hypothetical protein
MNQSCCTPHKNSKQPSYKANYRYGIEDTSHGKTNLSYIPDKKMLPMNALFRNQTFLTPELQLSLFSVYDFPHDFA